MKGYLTKELEVGGAHFKLYELNGLQRIEHLDSLSDIAAKNSDSESTLKSFLKIDLELQSLLVAISLKGPRWWVSKHYIQNQVKKLGSSVLGELYLAACALSNIPTPDEVSSSEKKIVSPLPEVEPADE